MPTAFQNKGKSCIALTFDVAKLARVNFSGFTILCNRKTTLHNLSQGHPNLHTL